MFVKYHVTFPYTNILCNVLMDISPAEILDTVKTLEDAQLPLEESERSRAFF